MAEFQVYETHNLSKSLLPFIYHADFVRVGPGLRVNWHENIEFLFCTGGSGYIQCGAEKHPFSPNDLFVVNADTLHTIGSQHSVTYQCLIVDRSFFENNGIPVGNLYFQNLIHNTEISNQFCAIADAYRNFDSKDFCSTVRIRSAVLAFILLLCQQYTTACPSESSPADSAIKQVIVYIRKHITQTITLDALAKETGFSKYHLSRQFKLATGVTIIEHINLARCNEAKRMIEKGSSVSAAALSCGFENLSYFTRTYKKYMGALPSSALNKHT